MEGYRGAASKEREKRKLLQNCIFLKIMANNVKKGQEDLFHTKEICR